MGLQGVGGQWPPGGWTEAPAGQSSQPPLEGLETGLLGDVDFHRENLWAGFMSQAEGTHIHG